MCRRLIPPVRLIDVSRLYSVTVGDVSCRQVYPVQSKYEARVG